MPAWPNYQHGCLVVENYARVTRSSIQDCNGDGGKADELHIKHLEGKVSDLATSLEFTQREVDDLKAQNKDHEKKGAKTEIDKLTEQVELSDKKTKELEERINYQDDYSRRKKHQD